jgi:signal transduction histidine kinase
VASGIAHEINNPLGIILNRIECMEVEAAQLRLSDEQQRDLLAIRTQADRISRITKSMLALSRGSATVLKPMDLNCVLRSCIEASKERAATKGVSIEAELAPGLPPIMGDRDRIETVMLNLINNAIDAAEDGIPPGLVTVRSEGCPGKEGNLVAVRISDTGPGIPEEMLGRIFDPFFTTKDEGQGTGLGLFLSYGIVADHRGRLEINNGRRGAVATISLPALVSVAESHQEVGWEQARY